ncbi:MAG: formate dehydrogenase accessory sulfurtransferase FdhD [bacterium]|nr:formate dehydrogenase accessory sulfurtransferase FdhD [bacterium]
MSQKKDMVAAEEEILMVINKTERVIISMSPDDLKPFSYGFLLTSGLITSVDEIEELSILGHRIDVQLTNAPEDLTIVLRSGCGSGTGVEADIETNPFDEVELPDLETLPELYKEFTRYSEVHDETGGVHSAAITDGSAIHFFSEDVGRHNAVDKVIGKALMRDVDLNDYFLLSSGRISGEIVKKAISARLRTIVSRAAPTCAAIVRARRANLGVVGFMRGKRYNVYTWPDDESRY